MEYSDRKAMGIKIAYIGGGSRALGWKLMADLALEPALSGDVWLYDIDRAAAAKMRPSEILWKKETHRANGGIIRRIP